MANFLLVVKATALVVALSGCTRYEAGNLDREHCEALRPGMRHEQVVAVMGQPRLTLDSQLDAKERTLIYNQPAMTDMPMFGEDNSVEVVMVLGASGYVLQEALCTGVDG